MASGRLWRQPFEQSVEEIPSMFEPNQSKPERILRVLVAGLLVPAPFVLEQNAYTVVCGTVGAILFFNAVTGTCLTYKLFGVNTCQKPPEAS
ncbi:MAG: DUF2892 domain-containing protein [Myxococcota bacterium]|nr:DUF2892 domain-containing protein [Myxococcota bacterium]